VAQKLIRGRSRPARNPWQDDPLRPRLEKAVAAILATGKVVAPVEVLMRMSILSRENFEQWRRGRVPYLEKVVSGNLTRLSRLLRILQWHAHDINLVPRNTVYDRWGKGPKTPLRFSKTGDRNVEEAYSRHFVWPGKGPFHPPRAKNVETG